MKVYCDDCGSEWELDPKVEKQVRATWPDRLGARLRVKCKACHQHDEPEGARDERVEIAAKRLAQEVFSF